MQQPGGDYTSTHSLISGGGTLTGNAAIVKRGKGHALSLNGKGSLKLANAKGYVKPGGSFTVTAWVSKGSRSNANPARSRSTS